MPTIVYFSMPKETRNDAELFQANLPKWFPKSHVKLGLDIQGGVQLVLGVDAISAVEGKLGHLAVDITRWGTDKNQPVATAYAVKGEQKLAVEIKDGSDKEKFRSEFKQEFSGLESKGTDGNKFYFGFSDSDIKRTKQSAMEQAERVVRSRIDKWGVAEPLISRRANGSILVQLPGFKDPEKAKELLGRTAQLKFKIVDDTFTGFDDIKDPLPEGITRSNNEGQTSFSGENREALTALLQPKVPEGKELLFQRRTIEDGKKNSWTSYVLNGATEITGDDVMDASVTQGNEFGNMPQVLIKFTGIGGKRFADVTGANIKKRMAIILDDVVESAPVIQGKIPGGTATITLGSNGGFNKVLEEATQLSLILKSGSVPATITVQEQRQVGASLGPELADQGVKGAGLGFLCVIIFMLVYYRRPGIIASMALLLNALFMLALMALFGFALSLPGIAGFILSLGMAVDANVLINERIRQEVREGKSGRKALEGGFTKVFWTIMDSNICSMIAAIVLLETASSGPIRGFAVTLLIGLVVSLFTALYVSKIAFELIVSRLTSESDIKNWLAGGMNAGERVYKINFLGLGRVVASLLVAVGLVTVGGTLVKGLNWGVEFSGGTEAIVKFAKDIDPRALTEASEAVGIQDMSTQALEGGKQIFILRYQDSDSKAVGSPVEQSTENKAASSTSFLDLKKQIESTFADASPSFEQVDYIGPQVGSELRSQGIQSLLYAVIGIMLYLALRFDLRFGPSLLVKMAVDCALVLGFYFYFDMSFDLTSVAGFLTIAGYSVNDAIVIFDRIRENIGTNSRRTFFELVNVSLNETLGRSINTSIVTLVSLTGIIVFCKGSIWNFAVAMALGVISATFTSTFVATWAVVIMEKFNQRRKNEFAVPKTV
jgi:protein-export membrane protein SecD/preprotein translocase SecF subunit